VDREHRDLDGEGDRECREQRKLQTPVRRPYVQPSQMIASSISRLPAMVKRKNFTAA
jgi:hypothetical protein